MIKSFAELWQNSTKTRKSPHYAQPRQLEGRETIEQILQHENVTIQEYKMLGGEIVDTLLATDLLNSLPDEYNFWFSLHKESREENDGKYYLTNVSQRLRIKKTERKKKTVQNFKINSFKLVHR